MHNKVIFRMFSKVTAANMYIKYMYMYRAKAVHVSAIGLLKKYFILLMGKKASFYE